MLKGADGLGFSPSILEKHIGCIKYTLLCFNVVCWVFGAALFGLTVWIRAEPGFDDWITKLDAKNYYIGIYILLAVSIVVMIFSFLGCVSTLMENRFALLTFASSQVFGFVLCTVGSAVLLDYSTMNSSLQPLIRNTMLKFVMTSEYPASAASLKMIQESIGCCGADGPGDYLNLKQPLPAECRDTVTGNAFFYGCVDELTWFLEDKSSWIAAMAMTLAFINVICAVISLVLTKALKREDEGKLKY